METETAVQKKTEPWPKLRFKEFSLDWRKEYLENLSEVITKGTTPNRFVSTGIKYVKLECLDGINIDESKCLFVDEKTHLTLLRRSILKKGDLLFAIAGATVGKVGIVTEEILPANTNQALAIVRLLKEEYLHFILQILQSSVMKRYIYKSVSIGAQPNLNLQQVGNFEFFIPSLPEQQKIASFLSSLDKKIQQLTRKKALLDTYKNGVMQKLFSQEIRFKDFTVSKNGKIRKNFPEWEVKPLGNISSRISYGMNSASKDFDGTHKYIRITDIDDNSRQLSPSSLTSPDGDLSEKYLVQQGDVLFARTGASVGKSYLQQIHEPNVYFAGFLIRFSIKDAVPYFVYSQTLTERYRKWVTVMSMRSGQPGINAEEYKMFKILLPVKKEQQKIADFLSAIDKKIETVSQQIEKTQTFKKGLLQQMFV
ncbi:restriction endonuclease subunit S [Salinimicrobium sp. WS361]|uniref:restriction endonuclease subunit S n=1 Tax=Salinimicrobium sp. WS361 TaxID=3425123 RepID=UPI003D6F83DA